MEDEHLTPALRNREIVSGVSGLRWNTAHSGIFQSGSRYELQSERRLSSHAAMSCKDSSASGRFPAKSWTT